MKDTNIKDLEDSLVFSMSLGNHELFHSNIWAALMKKHPTLVNIFFPEIKKGVITREKSSVDIEIKDGDKKYFIENKFKSLPNKEQLEKYSNEAGFEKGVLISLEEPLFDLPVKWERKDFRKIIESIKNNVAVLDGFDKDLITNYCDSTIVAMDMIKEKLGKTDGKWDLECKDLEKVKLDDIYKKIKGQQLERKIKDSLKQKEITPPEGFDFEIDCGYNNKKPTVSAWLASKVKHEDEGKKKGDKKIRYGIQIEGSQYRYMVVFSEETIKGHAKGDSLKWAIDQAFDSRWLEINLEESGRKSNVSEKNCKCKPHCKYDTNKYKAIYTYFTLKNDTYESIIKNIFEDMERACSLVEKFRCYTQ